MNAKEICELAKELDAETFAGQKDIDKKCQDIVMQQHIVEMQADKDFPSKPVGTGYGALITKQNYAFISTLPFIRFNAPRESQKEHAEMLEQATDAMWKASGAVRAWLRATSDAVTIGRGWVTVYPVPKRWSGPEFSQDGKSDEDFLSDVKEAKLRKFPLVVSHVDPRRCWPTRDEMDEVDEVVELGQMTVRRIRKAYGLELPNRKDTEKIDIVRYADDKVAVTVVKDKEPIEAKRFEHGLGMNPYVCLEMPVLPENDMGYRWAGSVFDLRYLIPEMDGALSDYRHNTKRMTHSQMVLNLDLEERRLQNPDAKSNADLINVKPDEPIILNKDESVGDQFVGGSTSPDILGFLNFSTMLTKENAIRPVLLGILEQGGDSGVRYNTGAQIAQGSFGPAIDYLRPAAEGITRRMLAGVTALSKEFPEMPDKVPVIYADGKGGSKTIEIGPKDVAGWGGSGTIQARIDLAIPINENAEIVTARLAADREHGITSEETAMGRWAHIENPRQEKHRRRLDRIERAMDDSLIQFVQQRAMQIQAQPGTSPNVLQQRFAALPPQVQQAVQMAAQGQGMPLPEARGEAGRAQQGMPQQLSNTEGTKLRGVRNE